MKLAHNRVAGDLLTVAQVAAYLQLNKLTVYKFIRSGQLRALRLGRSFRIRRTDVEGFLEAHKVAAPRGAQVVRSVTGASPSRPALRSEGSRWHSRSEADAGEPTDVREERRRRREAMIASNPLEWVIRGLH